jgi:hypothetical protein
MQPLGKQPEPNSIQFPVTMPTKVEEFKALHVNELNRRFGTFVNTFIGTHLNSFYYTVLHDKLVTKGKISQEIFEAYLTLKNITWGDMVPASETRRVLRRDALMERYKKKKEGID